MTTGTAPAWQARESAQQKKFEQLKRHILDFEEAEGYEGDQLFRVLLRLIADQLTTRTCGGSNGEMADIPFEKRERAVKLFSRVMQSVVSFAEASEERNLMLTKLLKWTADCLCEPYCAKYRHAERELLQARYGITNATDEVPIE